MLVIEQHRYGVVLNVAGQDTRENDTSEYVTGDEVMAYISGCPGRGG